MLSRIPVHRFDALSLLTCRSSIALRPIISRYFAPICSHGRLLSDSPAATAAAAKDRRRWVMLSSDGRRRPDDDSPFVADPNTVAESYTSKGRRVRVSFRCAPPPSSSYLYYDFPDSAGVDEGRDDDHIRVAAAHGELVLLQMLNPRSSSVEHFVYRPAAGTGRPPSLSLLPALHFDCPMFREQDSRGIGLLRRGENDLLVVQVSVDRCYDCDVARQMAVFSVLRPSLGRWELMEPVPVHQNGFGARSPQNVICVGDRFLCWVCYGCDFLLCDMADDEASPKVRHVGLPPEVSSCSYGNGDSPMKVRRMAAVGDSSVRLVSIHPHCCTSIHPDPYCYCSRDDHDCCCCVDDSDEACVHARFVFTVKTWTMNLTMDEPMEWVEDGEIKGEEIWALPGYEGLPHVIPEWPVVCLDEPDVVCFLVSNFHFTRDDEKLWMIQLNVKTKTLLSVAEFSNNYDYMYWGKNYHFPAEIQY